MIIHLPILLYYIYFSSTVSTSLFDSNNVLYACVVNIGENS